MAAYRRTDWDEEIPKRGTPPTPPSMNEWEDLIWTTYSINPKLPRKSIVEQLLILWRMPAEAMATVLGLDEDVIQCDIDTLREEWRGMGKALTLDERETARGRMIAELNRLKADIEDATLGNKDVRLLTLKLTVIDRLSKMLGLDVEKREPVREEPPNITEDVDNTDQILDGLEPTMVEELFARLNRTDAEE